MTSLARLTNAGVNVVGASASVTTNYNVSSIGATGATFDISSTGTGGGVVTIGSIGAGNVMIGHTGGTLTTSGIVDIGPKSTTVNIGNTGTGATTVFKTPITLGPAPTSSTQLGYVSSVSISAITLTGTGQPVATLTSLAIGTYVISATVVLQFTASAANQIEMSIQYPGGNIANNIITPLGSYTTTATSNTLYMNCSGIYINNASQNVTVNMSVSYAVSNNIATLSSSGSLKAVRIA
jgi:hypothetical protein